MKVFMTGAGGNMGFESFKAMSADIGKNYDLIVLLRDSEKNHRLFDPYKDMKGLTVMYGDLLNKEDVAECIRRSDMCLHIAAYVSPWADYHPEKAMQNNYGSTKNLIDAIGDQGKADTYKFIYIGTVAETGDRMPPIHWGRVGDPIKPSMFDYYAVSKIASERYVIESGLKYWVSLRQTGIIGPAMSESDGEVRRAVADVLAHLAPKSPAEISRFMLEQAVRSNLNAHWIIRNAMTTLGPEEQAAIVRALRA